jgi:hypothetical protein
VRGGMTRCEVHEVRGESGSPWSASASVESFPPSSAEAGTAAGHELIERVSSRAGEGRTRFACTRAEAGGPEARRRTPDELAMITFVPRAERVPPAESPRRLNEELRMKNEEVAGSRRRFPPAFPQLEPPTHHAYANGPPTGEISPHRCRLRRTLTEGAAHLIIAPLAPEASPEAGRRREHTPCRGVEQSGSSLGS